jgi:CRISPR-associated RAMP protein (TIGR02581 family)
VLLREVLLEGYLVNRGPLRVGTGREPPLGSAVDLAVIRVRLGDKLVPYIPGSSLKGVFRSVAVQLARLKGLSVCSGLSGETCMDWEYTELGGATLLSKIQEMLREREGESADAIKLFHEKACLLCKVFGSPSFTGHVEFSDAYPIGEDGSVLDVPVGVRTGIAINRRTGAVYRGALYQVEYVEPGARFRFSVRATNLPNYALGLLARILRMLNDGWVRVGGFKTRGFGEVAVEGLRFKARGPTVQGTRMLAVDEHDLEVDLADAAGVVQGWLSASGDGAWRALARLEGVWEVAKLG